MQFFQVSYERFLREINIENIREDSKDKLEREDLGKGFAYYLTSPDRGKGFVYIVSNEELTDVQKLQLDPISLESRRITDSTQFTKITQLLGRIEQELIKHPRIEKHFEREIIEKEIIVEGKIKK